MTEENELNLSEVNWAEKGLQKILVPVDGSGPSKRAVAKAAYLAGLSGAKLTLVNVVDLNKQISTFEQVSTGGYVPSELKEEGYQLLAELMHEVPPTVKAKALVEIGAPGETVVEMCEEQKFDLIVIGSRGQDAIQRLVMGSVSEYVMHHSTCPMLVVK